MSQTGHASTVPDSVDEHATRAAAESPGSTTLVDAHHHFWDLQRNHYPWLSDHPLTDFFMGPYDALKRNFLPEDYRREAVPHRVLKTVHVEAEWDRNDQIGETRWLTDLHARHGMPNAIVAHAWFHTADPEPIIAAQAAFPLVRGIRSKPATGRRPGELPPGSPGTMQDPAWLRGFALLEKYYLSWDLRVPAWHLAEAAQVARMFPRIKIALNHTGFPWDRSQEGLAQWRLGMEAIAAHSNVHLKVSEFGLKDRSWDYESNRRVVLEAIGIFGIDRCMFASDAPVSGLRIDFVTLVSSMKRMLKDFSDADQRRFFVSNAESFYRI